jgi:hypothetical protein
MPSATLVNYDSLTCPCNSLVLMNTHKVEPVVLDLTGFEELDLFISECSIESFITNIAHTVQCKLCPAFLKKNGSDFDVV